MGKLNCSYKIQFTLERVVSHNIGVVILHVTSDLNFVLFNFTQTVWNFTHNKTTFFLLSELVHLEPFNLVNLSHCFYPQWQLSITSDKCWLLPMTKVESPLTKISTLIDWSRSTGVSTGEATNHLIDGPNSCSDDRTTISSEESGSAPHY